MPPLLGFLLLFLLSRFFFLKESKATTVAGWGLKTLVDTAVLLYVFGISELGMILAGVSFLLNTGVLTREVFTLEPDAGMRSGTLLIAVAIPVLLDATVGPTPFRLDRFDPALAAFICAALLCLKESNYVVRWFFERHQLEQKISDRPLTENGRIIGNLERLLLLFFLFHGAPLAATFIVAVKGLARFKRMEADTAFAEYVIIGTFLSVLLALVIFQCTRIWLRVPNGLW